MSRIVNSPVDRALPDGVPRDPADCGRSREPAESDLKDGPREPSVVRSGESPVSLLAALQNLMVLRWLVPERAAAMMSRSADGPRTKRKRPCGHAP